MTTKLDCSETRAESAKRKQTKQNEIDDPSGHKNTQRPRVMGNSGEIEKFYKNVHISMMATSNNHRNSKFSDRIKACFLQLNTQLTTSPHMVPRVPAGVLI